MKHSLIVISPVSRLISVSNQKLEPLGALITGDGFLPIALYSASENPTHYGCHAGGTSATAVTRIEAVYKGQMSSDALPPDLTKQDVINALSQIIVSIDGRIMGVDLEYPENRLNGQDHFNNVLFRIGLQTEPTQNN